MCCRVTLPALLLCLFALCGCGGGEKSGSKAAPVKFSIVWSGRSRAVNAPSSALSAVITLANANSSGGNFTYSVNRDTAPDAYTGNYTSANSAKTGTAAFTARFYAQADGGGAVVGIAQSRVTINADGTGIGNISTTNTVASVSVPAGQAVRVGQSVDLAFMAQDAQGNMVAVTPGSAVFTVADGGDKLQISSGQAKGLAAGTATVSVVLDGKTSAATPFAVNPLTPLAYSITDLGTLPDDVSSFATSINAQGTIAGVSMASNTSRRAVLWKNGVIHEMGVPYQGNDLYPNKLNNAEQVVGTMNQHSFYWENGVTTDLGTLGGDFLLASSLNNSGVVTGVSNLSADPENRNTLHGFLWQKGVFTDLGGDFLPFTINDAGILAGRSKNLPDSSQRAELFQNGTITDIGLLPGGSYASGVAINAAAHVTGYSFLGNTRAFIWKDGMILDLEATSGRITHFVYSTRSPNAINDLDQIVGSHHTEADNALVTPIPFLYSEGRLVDLQTLLPANSGWQISSATDINNSGLIVGSGLHNGNPRAFLMTPQ